MITFDTLTGESSKSIDTLTAGQATINITSKWGKMSFFSESTCETFSFFLENRRSTVWSLV